MAFEWDRNKDRINLEKHHISFALAIEVFSDQLAIETTRVVNGEEQIQIVGKIENIVVSVVYTVRRVNIRIISARIASKKERLAYGQKTTARAFKSND